MVDDGIRATQRIRAVPSCWNQFGRSPSRWGLDFIDVPPGAAITCVADVRMQHGGGLNAGRTASALVDLPVIFVMTHTRVTHRVVRQSQCGGSSKPLRQNNYLLR